MNEIEWRQSLKPGDKVYISGRYGRLGAIKKVVRTTKTQILVQISDNFVRRFQKSTGFSIGGSIWHRDYMRELTSEIEEEIQVNALYYEVLEIADKMREQCILPNKKNRTELERIKKLFQEILKKE